MMAVAVSGPRGRSRHQDRGTRRPVRPAPVELRALGPRCNPETSEGRSQAVQNHYESSSEGSQAKRIVVGVAGASGGIYAMRLIQRLAACGVRVHAIVSPYGRQVLGDELGVEKLSTHLLAGDHGRRITIHRFGNLSSRLASGSFLTDGMVVCPCSSNTLGAVASGLGDNLITRAAQVTLKERRRLVLVHREMPLTEIDIRNMLRISRAGGIICPAAPGFYMTQEITLNNMTNGHTVAAGGVFTIANVNAWDNRKNQLVTPARPQQFIVVTGGTVSGGAVTLRIFPAIIVPNVWRRS